MRIAIGILAGLIDRLVAELRIFEQGCDGVESESGDAFFHPEAHDIVHRFADFGVAPVQIGLFAYRNRDSSIGRASSSYCQAEWPKMEIQLLGGWWPGLPSRQTYQSALGFVREERDSRNHLC